jgi:hypothetical protein
MPNYNSQYFKSSKHQLNLSRRRQIQKYEDVYLRCFYITGNRNRISDEILFKPIYDIQGEF